MNQSDPIKQILNNPALLRRTTKETKNEYMDLVEFRSNVDKRSHTAILQRGKCNDLHAYVDGVEITDESKAIKVVKMFDSSLWKTVVEKPEVRVALAAWIHAD